MIPIAVRAAFVVEHKSDVAVVMVVMLATVGAYLLFSGA